MCCDLSQRPGACTTSSGNLVQFIAHVRQKAVCVLIIYNNYGKVFVLEAFVCIGMCVRRSPNGEAFSSQFRYPSAYNGKFFFPVCVKAIGAGFVAKGSPGGLNYSAHAFLHAGRPDNSFVILKNLLISKSVSL